MVAILGGRDENQRVSADRRCQHVLENCPLLEQIVFISWYKERSGLLTRTVSLCRRFLLRFSAEINSHLISSHSLRAK